MTLPKLILGTMTFGDTADRAESARIFKRAVAEGITWIDTANVYSGGGAEEILADLVPGNDSLVLATKVGMPHPDAQDRPPLSPAAIRSALEGSLRRLRMERVDILYLHKPDRATPIRETLETIAVLIDEGKVGQLGVSNFAAWQLAELLHVAQDVGIAGPVASQQIYNPLARRLDDEYSEFARTVGLETVIYNPLAGGLLTGKYRFEEQTDSGRFGSARIGGMYRDRYWDSRMFDAVESLKKIADTAGVSLLELALRWTQSRPVANSVLLGASTEQQLESSVRAIREGPLDEDTLDAIDEVGAELSGPMPPYNR